MATLYMHWWRNAVRALSLKVSRRQRFLPRQMPVELEGFLALTAQFFPLFSSCLTPHGTLGLFAYASAAFVTAAPSSLSGVRWILRGRLGDGQGANWRVHRDAWAGRERGRCSQTPLAPGTRELRQAGRADAREKSALGWSLGATLDCQASGRAALAEQVRPTPSRRVWARESASESARAGRTARMLAPWAQEPSRAGNECPGRPYPRVMPRSRVASPAAEAG